MAMRTGPVGVRWGGPGHPGGEASPGQGSNLKAASSFGGAPDAMLPSGGRMTGRPLPSAANPAVPVGRPLPARKAPVTSNPARRKA